MFEICRVDTEGLCPEESFSLAITKNFLEFIEREAAVSSVAEAKKHLTCSILLSKKPQLGTQEKKKC